MMTKALAKAFAPSITVNSVAPGVIPFADIDERAKQMITATPALRGGTPDEVAGAVVYFLVAAAVSAVMAPLGEFTDAMTRSRTDMPPEVRQVFEWVSANPSLALVFDFFARLFVGSIVATVGGMLGAAFFRNDVPPALGGPVQPPPLPPM